MSQYVHAFDQSGRFLENRQGALARALRYLILALRVHAARRQLAQLDDARLADIGITRADAEREAARPLLDIPAHRKSGLYL